MTCVSSDGSERRAIWPHGEIGTRGKFKPCLLFPVQIRVGLPPARSSRELVCRAKRFDKSERRLAAGQTALICRYGEIRLDTSNLRFDGSDTIWVRIPVAVPGFLSFGMLFSAGTFYLILVIPGSFDMMPRSISYRKQQGFVSRVFMQRSYNG